RRSWGDLDAIPPALLRAVQRDIRALDQIRHVLARAPLRDADRDAEEQGQAVADVERALADALAHALADLPRAPGIGLRQHGDELLAAVAHEQVATADRAAQPARDLREHHIADAVAVLVVDRLEVIDIDERERQRAVAIDRSLDLRRQALL